MATAHCLLGNTELINTGIDRYLSPTAEDLQRAAKTYFVNDNRVVLHYLPTPNSQPRSHVHRPQPLGLLQRCRAAGLLFPALMTAQLDRSVPPAPGPAPLVRIGEHATSTLPNGVHAIVVAITSCRW